LNIPNSRTVQYQNNFFVDTVIRWNHLPDTSYLIGKICIVCLCVLSSVMSVTISA
jgi:hypothetical protein